MVSVKGKKADRGTTEEKIKEKEVNKQKKKCRQKINNFILFLFTPSISVREGSNRKYKFSSTSNYILQYDHTIESTPL